MLIGVVGFIGSGKGTVGDHLHRELKFYRDSFAKPLKDAVSIIFGWDREMVEGITDESREWREQIDPYWSDVIRRQVSPRIILQEFGTECIRNIFHSNVWSASLIKRYEQNNFEDTVITDCRFKNETKSIHDAGGHIICVTRGDWPEWYEEYVDLWRDDNWYEIDKLRDKGIIPHLSETDLIGENSDFYINNNGTIIDLEHKIDNIIHIIDTAEKI